MNRCGNPARAWKCGVDPQRDTPFKVTAAGLRASQRLVSLVAREIVPLRRSHNPLHSSKGALISFNIVSPFSGGSRPDLLESVGDF